MSVQVQHRRDSATNLAGVTPAVAEIGYDTTNAELLYGNGTTAGGIKLAKKSDVLPSTAAAAVADTDTLAVNQGAASNVKQTYAAVKTWIKSWIAKADVGLGNVPNTDCTNASNISGGTLANARLPASPSVTSIATTNGATHSGAAPHVILSSNNTFGAIFEYQNNSVQKWGTLNSHSGDGFGTNFWCLYNYPLATAAVKFDPSNNAATFSNTVSATQLKPTSAPNAAWGFDGTAQGAISIANNATYDLAVGSGLLHFIDDGGGFNAGVFFLAYGGVVTILNKNNTSTTAGNAGTTNVFYNAGTGTYRIENKTGSTLSLYVGMSRSRPTV